MKKRWICDSNVKSFRIHSKGIGYYLDLPTADDVKQLDRLLAALSGKRVRDSVPTPGQSTFVRLIEEGSSPRDNVTYEFAEQDSREEEKEKAFNRTALRALILCGLFLTLIPIVLIILTEVLKRH